MSVIFSGSHVQHHGARACRREFTQTLCGCTHSLKYGHRQGAQPVAASLTASTGTTATCSLHSDTSLPAPGPCPRIATLPEHNARNSRDSCVCELRTMYQASLGHVSSLACAMYQASLVPCLLHVRLGCDKCDQGEARELGSGVCGALMKGLRQMRGCACSTLRRHTRVHMMRRDLLPRHAHASVHKMAETSSAPDVPGDRHKHFLARDERVQGVVCRHFSSVFQASP